MQQSQLRQQMVENQIVARGVKDPAVLTAMRTVARELFVAPDLASFAYSDKPLEIPESQSISQPYIVALMLEALQLEPEARVLEIGTGSGYAAAVLSQLADEVHTVERLPGLAAEAEERLRRLGYANVHCHLGDGSLGWVEAAPYDAIVVAAASPKVPQALRAQLKPGGRLVVPVGRPNEQRLRRILRTESGYEEADLGPVRFVPLIGEGGWPIASDK